MSNSMHDQELHEELSAFIDGELDPERARFLQQRLAHDADLRARWERWQLLSSSMRRQALPLPAGFAERVGAALAAQSVPALPTRNRALRWAGGAALAASLGVAGMFVFDAMRSPQPVMPAPVAPQVAAVHVEPVPAAPRAGMPPAVPAQADAVKPVASRMLAARSGSGKHASAVERIHAEMPGSAIKLPIPVQSGVVTAFRSPLRPLLMRLPQQRPDFSPFPQPYPIDPELEAYLQQQRTGASRDVFARDRMSQPDDGAVRQVAWPQDGQH